MCLALKTSHPVIINFYVTIINIIHKHIFDTLYYTRLVLNKLLRINYIALAIDLGVTCAPAKAY